VEKPNQSWTYGEGGNGRQRYEIYSGDRVVGHVKSRGDAELICRAGREAVRSAMLRAVDARQFRRQTNTLRADIRCLMESLHKIGQALKRGSRPREILAAREEVRRVIRKMRSRGHCL
jgi:hypothetical protein